MGPDIGVRTKNKFIVWMHTDQGLKLYIYRKKSVVIISPSDNNHGKMLYMGSLKYWDKYVDFEKYSNMFKKFSKSQLYIYYNLYNYEVWENWNNLSDINY